MTDTPIGATSTDSPTPSESSPSTGSKPSEKADKLSEGTKYDGGKAGVHLLPPGPLLEITKVLDFGATKYAPWNWSKGISWSRVYGATLRHLWAWYRGEDLDPETGLNHLAHAGGNLLFLLQYSRTKTSFDDRPIKELS